MGQVRPDQPEPAHLVAENGTLSWGLARSTPLDSESDDTHLDDDDSPPLGDWSDAFNLSHGSEFDAKLDGDVDGDDPRAGWSRSPHSRETVPDLETLRSLHLTTLGEEGDRPGQFCCPTGVAVDAHNLYVADDTRRIHVIGILPGPTQYMYRYFIDCPHNPDNPSGRRFDPLVSIAVDDTNLYVVGYGHLGVRVFNKSTRAFVRELEVYTGPPAGDDPTCVAVDADRCYVVAGGAIEIIDKVTGDQALPQIGGHQFGGGAAGEFIKLDAVAVDDLHVYATDAYFADVQVFNKSNGQYIRVFGGMRLAWNQAMLRPSTVIGWDDFGPHLVDEPHAGPMGLKQGRGKMLCVDANYAYIVDRRAALIVVYHKAGGTFVRSWGGHGRAAGKFHLPVGIACDDGHVYVSDSRQHRVQVFRSANSLAPPRGPDNASSGTN